MKEEAKVRLRQKKALYKSKHLKTSEMKVETTKEIANYSKYSHTHTHAERKGEIYRRVDCVVVACLSYHLLATHQNGK